MNTKDLLTISTAAIATAALTVATLGGGSTEAGGDAAAPAAKITAPSLVTHGVTLTLNAKDNRVFKTGEQPEFELKAMNGTQPATVHVALELNSTTMASLASRVMRSPNILWHDEMTLSLKPNETKVMALAAKTNLPPNCFISVVLREAGTNEERATLESSLNPNAVAISRARLPAIVALNFSTLTNMAVSPVVITVAK